MRKRTIKYISDKALWLFAMLIPLIYTLVVNFHYTETHAPISVLDVFTNVEYGFAVANDNFILVALNELFGTAGVLPLWDASSFVPYFITYLVVIVLVQLAFDVITFIPKLAHKYMHKFTQDEE